MEFELGTGFLTMTDQKTGKQYDFGEITPMHLEQEMYSSNAESPKAIKCFSGTFSCGNTTLNQGLFNELCKSSATSGFTIEGDAPILIQARWHKKARIRKKWLKRYGYKEDFFKTIMKAKYGEFNAETGEYDIEIESIEYIFKLYQLQREVRR